VSAKTVTAVGKGSTPLPALHCTCMRNPRHLAPNKSFHTSLRLSFIKHYVLHQIGVCELSAQYLSQQRMLSAEFHGPAPDVPILFGVRVLKHFSFSMFPVFGSV
jgi:hypothetical protein